MTDWTKPFRASYRFMRVSRLTGAETERLSNIESGGTITRNSDTDTFESASLPFVGSLDIGSDLLRIYLDASFYAGGAASECLGTFLVNVPSRDVQGALSSAEASLDGRLQELADEDFDEAVTIEAGTDPVAAAAEIARGCGLEVVADPCSYRLSEPRTYGLGEDDKMLAAINDLLSAAGFSAAVTDPYGRVVMRRYVEPSQRKRVRSFEEGIDATFLGEATDERDKSRVANVVRAIYSTEDKTVVGVAVDDDPRSEFSTVAIGRRKVARYTYSDLPEGDTEEEMQSAADAEAARLLDTQQSVVHRVKIKHAYAPVTCDDVIGFNYGSAGIAGDFAIRTQDLELGAGCIATDEIREFQR